MGRGTIALSFGVRWRSGAAGVENLYFNSIKPKRRHDIDYYYSTALLYYWYIIGILYP